jgi:predicted XRE-type DNA-binding protein
MPTGGKRGKANQSKALGMAATAFIEDALIDQIRIKEVIEKSGADFDRISAQLRELTGLTVPKELLEHSWDLLRVLLAEAIELRDRSMIMYIIQEIIKRKEPKEQTIKTDIQVDQNVLVIVQDLEKSEIEKLVARRNAITVGTGKDRPVRAIPDRRHSRKKRS